MGSLLTTSSLIPQKQMITLKKFRFQINEPTPLLMGLAETA
jgi:hypothetical protein